MNIGIPKELRAYEYRVGLTPAGVKLLTQHGHICYVEHDAGLGAGFNDKEYEQAGASIVYTPHEAFGRADLLLKVSRPTLEEIQWLRPGATLAGFLHLGSTRQDQVEALLANQISSLAYELITLPDGTAPIRQPLSQIGGRLVGQIGAGLLQNNQGGKGILLGGMPGVPPADVVILGAGIVGAWAAQSMLGMNAHVTLLDNNLDALEQIYSKLPGVVTMLSNPMNILRAIAYADIVVGAVLVPGEAPPILITREMLRSMKTRSVLMDISIDEGGCFETSRPTTLEHPTFIEEGMIHYCVPNIPSIVARTATYAFQNAAFPYILELANKNIDLVAQSNPAIRAAIVTHHGELKPFRSTVSG